MAQVLIIDSPNIQIGNKLMMGNTDLLYWSSSLGKLESGVQMFSGCKNMHTFIAIDLSKLKDGSMMFENCSSLLNFTENLSSLTNGDNMFTNCKLNIESLQHIADTINDLASQGKSGVIHIGHDSEISQSDLDMCGWKLSKKGWTPYFNGEIYIINPYDVSELNGYIPNASKWNEEVYIHHDLVITRITAKGEMLNDE